MNRIPKDKSPGRDKDNKTRVWWREWKKKTGTRVPKDFISNVLWEIMRRLMDYNEEILVMNWKIDRTLVQNAIETQILFLLDKAIFTRSTSGFTKRMGETRQLYSKTEMKRNMPTIIIYCWMGIMLYWTYRRPVSWQFSLFHGRHY